MPETTFLEGASLWDEIKRLSTRPRRGPAYVAVAYVGKSAPDLVVLRRGDHLVVDASENALKSGQTNPRALEQYVRQGVAVHSHPGLHAKVYVFGNVAISGSPNASRHSELYLLEAGFRTTTPSAVVASRSFVTNLEVPHEALDLRRLRHLQRFYREPKYAQGAARARGVFPVTGDSVPRLHLAQITDHDPSEAESRVIKASRRTARRAAGPVAAVDIDTTTFIGGHWYSEGDFIIRVTDGAPAEREVYPPGEIFRIDPVTSRRQVLWVATRTPLETIKWAELTSLAKAAGLTLNPRFPKDRWIQSRRHRQAIVSAWPAST